MIQQQADKVEQKPAHVPHQRKGQPKNEGLDAVADAEIVGAGDGGDRGRGEGGQREVTRLHQEAPSEAMGTRVSPSTLPSEK